MSTHSILGLVNLLYFFVPETNIFRPYFEKTSHDVTVQLGDNAFFECHIFNLHNQTVGVSFVNLKVHIVMSQVSWIRRSDGYPLYIGDERFINDKRFELISTRLVVFAYCGFQTAIAYIWRFCPTRIRSFH